MKISVKKYSFGYFLLLILVSLMLPVSVAAFSFTVQNGPGGTVTSNVGGVNCSSDSDCTSSNLADGTSVTLTANPGSGKLFKQWGGKCSGTSTTCQFSMTAAWQATASWKYKTVPMTIKFSGNGSGSVSISSTGTCTSNCTKNISHTVSSATLKATPASGSKFAGWDYENGANSCYSGGGKGPAKQINTSSTCTRSLYFGVENGYTPDYVAVPIFNKTSSSSSSGSSSDSSSESSSSGSDSSSDSSSTTEKDGSPKSPTVEKIKVGDSEVSTKDPIEVSSDEPLVLSGKTVPNGIVTLTIHSDPFTVTTKADKDGNWSYTIQDLPAGDHYVEASVKDPKTKKTSKIGKLLSFTVASADSPASTVATAAEDVAASSSKNWLIALPIVAIVLAAGGWFGWKWWKAHKTQPSV